MIKSIFCVFDAKSKVYDTVHFEINKAVALRSFEKACNDPSTALFEWPEDYVLFELGTFDTETGKIVTHECPLTLGVAIEYKRSEPKVTPVSLGEARKRV